MKRIGATYLGNGRCTFSVWAPEKKKMFLQLVAPENRKIAMQPAPEGYFTLTEDNISRRARYFFMPEGEEKYPDPASYFQPEGVHGPSEVVDHSAFPWQDQTWKSPPLKELILYELHVGTFTPEGTFEAIIPRLKELTDTGINALELMPVNQFPGSRNWGYDGVYPYSVHESYGGPEKLKELVNACHAHGIAVFLDVVYNHLGPEGNYFEKFGPYFTDKYTTPWGKAFNFDGEWSDEVREYFINNALYWFETYHLDGLRLDAIHMAFDLGAVHIWEVLSSRVKTLEEKLGRPLHLTAECDFNSPKVIKHPEAGGFGFDAQWLDDFNHALYVMLDEKGRERYYDYGQLEQVAKAYTDGFVHSGEYVKFRKRRHGVSSAGVPGEKFIVFNQNHDQVGNRVKGERLSLLVDFERLKIAAAAILLAPYVPMLFMGEEYAEEAPFFYFVSHSDKKLIEAVRQGRQKEFAAFGFNEGPPDAQAPETFNRCKLNWEKRKTGKHNVMLHWHQHLISLRKTHPVLHNFCKNDVRVNLLGQAGFELHRQAVGGQKHLLCLFNLTEEVISYTFPAWSEKWQKIVDSKEGKWLETKDLVAKLLPDAAKAGTNVQLPLLSVTVYESLESTKGE
ncbi:malto-oligosyltrehalose trehalohydrolase [Adhaeribacter soli]|uniref:Malto-oligosyltrehalose trehalohydrolase n=1 Tax=Adhaeribacter soli TaxID=2607655 RepID=A0A5N1J3Q3_9BACT|nr:malto-oligosyltrehalose trehalohydrolase [Adhaeribacter soli]KAA9345531.1 malto-oligosyltrehalose trehalohydrolase [Adhaeribacter soli]